MSYKNIYNTVNKALEQFAVNTVLDRMEASKLASKARKRLEEELFNQIKDAIDPKKIEQSFLLTRKANQTIMAEYDLEDLSEEMLELIEDLLVETANASGQAAVNRIDERVEFELENKSFIRERILAVFGVLGVTSKKFIANKIEQGKEGLLTPEETEDLILQEAEKAVKNRARMIIDNEIAYIAGTTEYEVFRRSGVTALKWVTVGDERVCPICVPLDGKEVSTGADFKAPTGEIGQHPPIHVGCRCYLIPTRVDGFRIWNGS